MTSSGHIGHAQTITHGHFPIGCSLEPCDPATALPGFVSEIFSPKVATKIITWWRHHWCHKPQINYPWGP